MSYTIDLNLLLKESKNTLLNPKRYFSSLKLTGGMNEPLIKAVIYGIVTGIIYLIFYLLRIKALGAGNIGDAVGLLAFIKIIFEAVIGLFITAVILFIISSICKGKTEIEANLRVTSSLMAILPVYAVLSISWNLHIYLGLVISAIMFLYFLWLLYYGLVESLKSKKEYARIVCYVLMCLVLLFLLLRVSSTGKTDSNMNDKKLNHKELKKS
jgi:hypothetical protein